jgi:outer membrane protein OmpA-like peptidoglycan-associated protein/tetratricopeptide (TPR) repeat protein
MALLKKTILTIVIFALMAINLLAQQGSGMIFKKAEKLFENFEYAAAADLYERLANKDSTFNYAKIQAAECYRKLSRPVLAAKWYGEAIQDTTIARPIHSLYYAQALMSLEKYDSAKIWLEHYRESNPDEFRVNDLIAGIDDMSSFYNDSSLLKIEPAIFNTPQSEFAPAFYKDGLVYSSSRDEFKIIKHKTGWDKTNYFQLYYTEHKFPAIDNSVLFGNNINTRYHEGTVTFFDDFEKMIFTRNFFYEHELTRSQNKVANLQLFLVERENKDIEFSNPIPFQFSDPENSYGHPSISEDEMILYFTSDIPGGYGGTDIYRSFYDGENWGEPQNLGPQINTEGNEVFPFIRDNILFFSSNGHRGLGGLDIYRADIGDSIYNVKNVGYPVNSSRDDFSAIIEDDRRNGFFASNREGGIGEDDIYAFEILVPELVTLKGLIVDEISGDPVNAAAINIDDTLNTYTFPDGTFEIKLERSKTYEITASKTYWTSNSDTLTTLQFRQDTVSMTILIKPQLIAEGYLTNRETQEVIEGAKLTFTKSDSGDTASYITNEDGRVQFVSQPNTPFNILYEKEGFFTKQDTFRLGTIPSGIVKFDLIMKPIEIGKVEHLYDIRFEFNKAEIDPEYTSGLDEIARMLLINPNIKIEMKSHSDSKGNDDYNLALSHRRAQAAADYIIGMGVPQSQIIGVGYGERELVNGCSNGVPCTEAQHRENRRVEFLVIEY